MDKYKGYVLKAALLSAMAYPLLGYSAEMAAEPTTLLPPPNDLNADAIRLKESSVKTIHGDIAGKSAPFITRKGCDFFITGDLLYRKAKLDHLDFATEVISTYSTVHPTPTTTIAMSEHSYEPHFRWGWGCRVDAGYLFTAQDAWEVDLIWTYFYDKAHQSASAPPNTTGLNANVVPTPLLFNTWMPLDSVLNVSSSWHLHFNTFDFELARNYFQSKYLSIRPLISLRGAWIKQHFVVDSFNETTSIISTDSSTMDAKTTYWGIGPRIGADLFWNVTHQWGFYGNLSGSLLYGHFRVQQDYFTHLTIGMPGRFQQIENFSIKTSKNPWRGRANFDAGIGMEYETFLDKKHDLHLTLGLGYEIAYWFAMNILDRTTFEATPDTIYDNQEENGDLGMQGWNFHARFDF